MHLSRNEEQEEERKKERIKEREREDLIIIVIIEEAASKRACSVIFQVDLLGEERKCNLISDGVSRFKFIA